MTIDPPPGPVNETDHGHLRGADFIPGSTRLEGRSADCPPNCLYSKFDPQALQDLATQMLAQREVKEVPETEADFEEMSVSKPATPIWVS